MNKTVLSGSLSGKIQMIPSKSAAHRSIIMAALCKDKPVSLFPVQMSADIQATLACCQSLGLMQPCSSERADALGQLHLKITPVRQENDQQERFLDCGESGSTLRFMIPLALDGKGPVTFTGHGRLMQRPLSVYEALFQKDGCLWKQQENKLTVCGRLESGDFFLPGDVSSQFVTGLLLVLPLLEGDSRIILTSPLQSSAYVELTRELQQNFGVHTAWVDEKTLQVPGKQQYHSPCSMTVEGDWSHAAFYLTAGLISHKGAVEVAGLKPDSVQADRAILSILRSMGGMITENDNGSFTACPSPLHGVEVDCSQCPDIVPILAAAMACADGTSRITGAARLRLKESDRLEAMKNALSAIGISCEALPDGLIIQGSSVLHGATVSGVNDHRIVMAMAIAAARCGGPVTITDSESVAKSAPLFWEEYKHLGGVTI